MTKFLCIVTEIASTVLIAATATLAMLVTYRKLIESDLNQTSSFVIGCTVGVLTIVACCAIERWCGVRYFDRKE